MSADLCLWQAKLLTMLNRCKVSWRSSIRTATEKSPSTTFNFFVKAWDSALFLQVRSAMISIPTDWSHILPLPAVSKALFKAVNRNGNGELDLTDVMALAAIISKLNGRFGGGSGANASAQSVPLIWNHCSSLLFNLSLYIFNLAV